MGNTPGKAERAPNFTSQSMWRLAANALLGTRTSLRVAARASLLLSCDELCNGQDDWKSRNRNRRTG